MTRTPPQQEQGTCERPAASGGEVVCWQYQDRDGLWRSFVDEAHRINTVADGTWPIRALYTTPPASVPADALERLVEKWRSQAPSRDAQYGDQSATSIAAAMHDLADELAALIQKGDDHG